ncbi:primosomal protein DnaI [Pediococcus pentosaceus]|uniref:primosomal protein DnaI n=1 Tax=Pediococcus pentosaceus TaxID=1255 RepID=UPI0010089771|nr:primosomal protein DnaI [Pediococcus pentosaceus]MBF7122944.1 primosomal protein DnaI [Pediococcus pentosaceus]MCR1860510.1 primosomal protein DnaI [Pediococcus pentosaceus]RXI22477.1 primosomal protein DnaI [Pediococcus pentosaceus]
MENVREILQELMSKRKLDQRFNNVMKSVYSDPEVISFCEEHQDELSKEAIERGAAKLYEFVSERNKIKNNQATFLPGYQPELVLSNHLVDIEYVPTKQTHLLEQERHRKALVKSISMPKLIRHASLEGYYQEPERTDALAKTLAFVNEYLERPQDWHKGLYLTGSFGVGKTYLMGAMGNALADEGYSTTIVHFPSLAVELKNAIGSSNTIQTKIDAIKKAPILVIDDIGADSISSWIRDDVLGVILEYRMQEELPTFFTSNFSMDQLEREHLTVNQRGEAEPLKAKRLMERIKFLSEEVSMTGKNHRQD